MSCSRSKNVVTRSDSKATAIRQRKRLTRPRERTRPASLVAKKVEQNSTAKMECDVCTDQADRTSAPMAHRVRQRKRPNQADRTGAFVQKQKQSELAIIGTTAKSSQQTSNADGSNDKAGYKKPPKEHQFKKGQSGNPKGRPKKKKSTTVAEIARSELLEPMLAQVGGKTIELPAIQIAMKRALLDAAKGNTSSQRLVLSLAKTHLTNRAVDIPLAPEEQALLMELLDNE